MNKMSKEKAIRIAREFMSLGGKTEDKGKALLNLGYKKSYALGGRGMKLFEKEDVKNEVNRLRAILKIDADKKMINVQEKFLQGAEIALKKQDLTNYNRAYENIAKIQGDYEKDNLQKVIEPQVVMFKDVINERKDNEL
jgi:hypothetical protein